MFDRGKTSFIRSICKLVCMQKVALLFISVFISIIPYSQNTPSTFPLIPFPKEIKFSKETFSLTAKTKIILFDTSLRQEVGFLNNHLKSNYNIQLAISTVLPKSGHFILFKHTTSKPESEESYNLKMNPTSIQITAANNTGIFYAIETLIQLMPTEKKDIKKTFGSEVQIPCADISDSPQYQWRSMHLDCSRHFFSKEEVKKYIDYLAMYKFNVFHWHLTDDQGWRIEIKKYPLLTAIGSKRKETLIGRPKENKYDGITYNGFYTKNDIKEVVDYAAKRHITVLPEIEMPGHSTAALSAYPQYSCTGGPFETATNWGIKKEVYCAGNDSTFLFIQNVLTEVMDLFPGKYIHIGGDECPKDRWKTCRKCQQRMLAEKLAGENELQSYFIKRIEKFVNARGKQIIGWDEILEGGLAPNAAVMSWRGTEGGATAAKQHHYVVMTPGKPCYFDHYQSKEIDKEPIAIGGYNPLDSVYTYNPSPKGLNEEEAKFILGAQGCVWTEYIPDFSKVEYMSMPRMAALSEAIWTPADKRNYSDFINRLKLHAKTLDKLNINYARHFLNRE